MNKGSTFTNITKVDEKVKFTYNLISSLVEKLVEPCDEVNYVNHEILKAIDNLFVKVKNESAENIYYDMLRAFNAVDSKLLRQEIKRKSNIII